MEFFNLFNKKKGILVHNKGQCNYCGICMRRCPHKAIKVENKEWKLRMICMKCGRCVRECPQKALFLLHYSKDLDVDIWLHEYNEIVYKGNGFFISKHEEQFQIAFQVGIDSHTEYYDISKENAEKAMKSDQDAYEVMIFAETGNWPLSEEEKLENDREFIRKFPKLLNENNNTLFTEEELKELEEK